MVAAQPKAALFSTEKLSRLPATAGKPSAAEIASDAAASLVAPRRTISDITAILEQQKPDPAAVAKLAATADAPAPAGMKGADLADFYYKRAQARALLGRADALDDADLTVSNATSADYNNPGSRYEQLLARLLREAGQNKRANALVAKQMRTFANRSKGKLFGLNFSMVKPGQKWRHQRGGVLRRPQSQPAHRIAALVGVPDLRDGVAGAGRRRQRANR